MRTVELKVVFSDSCEIDFEGLEITFFLQYPQPAFGPKDAHHIQDRTLN